MYTVIQKSGIDNDTWKIAETFETQREAENFLRVTRQNDAHRDFYKTRIIRLAK